MSLLYRMKALAGLDANVSWTLMHRVAMVLAGSVLIFSVATFLSQEEQGYYYTFSSIVSVQVLFDLGLAQILAQIASHEFPFLDSKADDDAAPQANIHWKRLAFFARVADRWYRIASAIFVVLSGVGGYFYFSWFGSLPIRDWLPALLVLVAFTGLNLYLSPRLSFIDGAGYPARTASMRFFGLMIGIPVSIALLWLGAGLWAMVALPLSQFLLTLHWLRTEVKVFDFFDRRLDISGADPEWRSELTRLQSRVAVSWLGGYLMTVTITPILFAAQGPLAAGQWGLAFSLFSQVSALGISWTSARAPLFGELIARKDREALDQQFVGSTKRSIALVALGCTAIVIGRWLLEVLNLDLAERLLAIGEMALLGAATVANALVMCFAIYIRAHKEEPLVTSSLVIGASATVLALALAPLGTFYVVLSYALISIGLNLGWRLAIYRRYAGKQRLSE